MVVAKDRPNFIGNHLALYGVMLTLKALESGRYTIEEIDAMTGPAIGRPKSATFRTMDIAGIDAEEVPAHSAQYLSSARQAGQYAGTVVCDLGGLAVQ